MRDGPGLGGGISSVEATQSEAVVDCWRLGADRCTPDTTMTAHRCTPEQELLGVDGSRDLIAPRSRDRGTPVDNVGRVTDQPDSEDAPRTAEGVAARLRERVTTGAYAPGSRLPGRRVLADEFGLADRTIGAAVSRLRAEGLVYSVPSGGWYVRPQRAVVSLGRHRLSRAERQAGRGTFATDCYAAGLTPQVDTAVTTAPAPEDVAVALGLTPGELVVTRDRVMRASGEVLQLATSYLPAVLAETAPGIAEEDTGPGGIYARLDEAGHRLTEFSETVAIGRADEHEARQMGLTPGDPVYRVERTAWAGHQAVELNKITITGDRVVLTYDQPAE